MICNDVCSSDTSRCSSVWRPRSRKLSIFSRRRKATASKGSCAKSHVGKIGNAIKNVSRSMLCGLSRRSAKSSSRKSSRPQTPLNRKELDAGGLTDRSPSCLWTSGPANSTLESTGTPRQRKNTCRKSNLLSVFPVMVDTDASAADRGESTKLDDRLRMTTTRTVCIKPAKMGKSAVHQEIRSSNAPVDIRPKLLEGTKKTGKLDAEKIDLDLLNLNL
uniref:COMM domain-containing protein 1 n=1 Tax=Lygus hesperus TaxID=30085 RepID=A0A0A9W0W2_LYGHE